VGLLDSPLEIGVEYQLSITDVVNINGLRGGAGDVTLLYEPPPPDTVSQEVDGGAAGPPSGPPAGAPVDNAGGNAGGAAGAAVPEPPPVADTVRLRP